MWCVGVRSCILFRRWSEAFASLILCDTCWEQTHKAFESNPGSVRTSENAGFPLETVALCSLSEWVDSRRAGETLCRYPMQRMQLGMVWRVAWARQSRVLIWVAVGQGFKFKGSWINSFAQSCFCCLGIRRHFHAWTSSLSSLMTHQQCLLSGFTTNNPCGQ